MKFILFYFFLFLGTSAFSQERLRMQNTDTAQSATTTRQLPVKTRVSIAESAKKDSQNGVPEKKRNSAFVKEPEPKIKPE